MGAVACGSNNEVLCGGDAYRRQSVAVAAAGIPRLAATGVPLAGSVASSLD